MNPNNYKLSPEVLQELYQREADKRGYNGHLRLQDDLKHFVTPSDKLQEIHNSLFETLNKPLKKLTAAMHSEISNTCYKEKHLDPLFTNEPQIRLCEEKVKEKTIGPFIEKVHSYRIGEIFQLEACIKREGSNTQLINECMLAALREAQADNKSLLDFFKQQYPSYM